MSKDMKVGLLVETGTKGTEKLAALSETIKKTGIEADHLTEEGKQLAKTFAEISRQKNLIDNFQRLEEQLKDVTAELSEMDDINKRVAKGKGGNYTQQINRLKNLKEEQSKLNSELKETKITMESAGISTDKLSIHEKRLAAEAKKAQQALDKLNNEANELKALSEAKITLGIDTDEKAAKELTKVTNAYKTLKQSGSLSSKELARANELHTNKVRELEAQLGKTKPTIADVRGELGKLAGAGAAFTLMAREAMQFETAMTGVKKVVDGTPAEMESLGDSVKQLAFELGMTSEETANITAMGGQLGVAFKDLPQFTKLAGEMSVAFGMTAEEAANAAAKMANVWGIPLEEVRALGDAINTLGNNTAAKESEITQAMLRIGGNAKQFGLAAEQAAALADAMIALGKPPEVAATAINALLLKLQTAEVQGDKFKGALQGVGYSAEQMAENIKNNPQKAITDFIGSLKKMDKQARTIAIAEMFGNEYADDISLLVEGVDSLAKAFDIVGDKAATAGAMNKEFAAAMSTTDKKLAQSKTAISNLSESIGVQLLPIIGAAAEGVGGMANAIKMVADDFPEITKLTLLFAGAKIGVTALNAALKLMGKSGVKSFGEIALAAKATTTAIAAGEKKIISYSRATRTFKGDVAGLGRQLTSLNGILSGIAAFDIGAVIGNSLRENSDAIRDFGDLLGGVGSALESVLTTGSLEKYNQNFRTTVELEKEAAAEARKTAEAIAKKNQLLAEEKEKQEELAEAARQHTALVDQTLETYNQLLATKKRLEQAGDTETQHYTYISEQIKQLEPLVHNYNNEISKSGKILDETATKARKLAEANKAATEGFASLGVDVGKAMNGISSKAQQSMNVFKKAMADAKVAGTQNMEVTKAAIVAVLKTMDNPKEVASFNKMLSEMGVESNKASEKLGELNAKAAATAEKAASATDSSTKSVKSSTEATKADTAAKSANAAASENVASASADIAAEYLSVRNSFVASEKAVAQFDRAMAKMMEVSKPYVHYTEDLAKASRDAKNAYDDWKEETAIAAQYMARLNERVAEGSVSMADISAAANNAETNFARLNEDQLDKIKAEIDSAKQKVMSLEEQAKKTAQSIADELADATGDDEDRINRKFQRRIDDIREKDNGTGRYGSAVNDLEKLRAIELVKLRKREAEKVERERKRAAEKAERERTQAQSSGEIDVEAISRGVQTAVYSKRGNQQFEKLGQAIGREVARSQDVWLKKGADYTIKEIDKKMREATRGAGYC